jgi:hypothetical protein
MRVEKMTVSARCEMLPHDTGDCRHFSAEGCNCSLLSKLDAKAFGLLLAGGCDLTGVLNAIANKILHDKGRYHSYSGIDASDLVNDALLGLLALLRNRDFPFQSEKHCLNDLIGYCVQSMKHALLKYSTVKKFQGRYCVYFTDCCTVSGPDVSDAPEPSADAEDAHRYYGKRDCVDQNPSKMNPPCRRFASPLGQSISESDSSDEQSGNGMRPSDILGVAGQNDLDEIDRKNLLVKKWRDAKSIPEIRRVVRIIKYKTMEGGDMEGLNIAGLARELGLDPGTIRDDLETWAHWRSDALKN